MRKLYLAFLLSVSLLYSFSVGYAQVAPRTVRLEPQQLQQFDTALQQLSKQTGFGFICEDQPLTAELSPKQIKALQSGIEKNPDNPAEVIRQVALAYDYDAVPSSPTLYVLTKRFTDPEDLPAITFDEALYSMQSIVRVMEQFGTVESESVALRNLIISIPPEQRVQFAAGVFYNEMTPRQQGLVRSFAASAFFDNFVFLEKIAWRLKNCRTKKISLYEKDFGDIQVLMYEGPLQKNGTEYIVALNRWVITESGDATTIQQSPDVEFIHAVGANPARIRAKNGAKEPTTPDPANPSPVTKKRLPTLTVGAIVQRINKRLAQGKKPSLQVIVHPAIATKPLYIEGSDQASPEEVVRATATAYGLHLSRPKEDIIQIGLPPVRKLDSIERIPTEILRLMPGSFLRALKGGNQNQPMEMWGAVGMAFYVPCVRRIREIVEPKIAASPEKKILFSSLEQEEKDLIALAALLTCGDNFRFMARKVPMFLTRFDGTKIILRPNVTDPSEMTYVVGHPGTGKNDGSGVSGGIGFPPNFLP